MKDKKFSLNVILELRENINQNLWSIEHLLRENFPEYHSDAYQHWIAQVATALYNDTRWLPRGEKTCEDTINSIKDSLEF